MSFLDKLNNADTEQAVSLIIPTCGSERWCRETVTSRPFRSLDDLIRSSETVWSRMDEVDLLEAFTAHPRIGDIESLAKKFANTKSVAMNEQSSTAIANRETLEELAALNERYFEKFGFIFIIFATGKSAEEMLEALRGRLHNGREAEISNASKEQWKITALRLRRLFATEAL